MIVPFVYSMDRVASVLTVMRLVRAWKVAASKVMMLSRLVRVVWVWCKFWCQVVGW